MDEKNVFELVTELRRLNDAIEMLFGLPRVPAFELPLLREVQKLIDDDQELDKQTVWAMADNMGQAYVCVRSGFMQPPSCNPVDNIEDAEAYLNGIKRGQKAMKAEKRRASAAKVRAGEPTRAGCAASERA